LAFALEHLDEMKFARERPDKFEDKEAMQHKQSAAAVTPKASNTSLARTLIIHPVANLRSARIYIGIGIIAISARIGEKQINANLKTVSVIIHAGIESVPFPGIRVIVVRPENGQILIATDEEAVDYRKQIIEWLMMNHPHDCPVCDEGGQCLLQDMTVSGGHTMLLYVQENYRYELLGTTLDDAAGQEDARGSEPYRSLDVLPFGYAGTTQDLNRWVHFPYPFD
jgi:hypothetical protein